MFPINKKKEINIVVMVSSLRERRFINIYYTFILSGNAVQLMHTFILIVCYIQSMRTTGSFEYGADAEVETLHFVSAQFPRTTRAIRDALRKRKFAKIHYDTTKRILDSLQKRGKIRSFMVGKARLWQK